MITVGTVLGMGDEGIKENDGGVNSNAIYLIYHKNFCKCHNIPPPCTTIINRFWQFRKKPKQMLPHYAQEKLRQKWMNTVLILVFLATVPVQKKNLIDIVKVKGERANMRKNKIDLNVKIYTKLNV
jgi:hypothetical protein